MPIQEPEHVTQFSIDTTCIGGPSMPTQTSVFDNQFTAQLNDDIGAPSDDDNEDDREAYVPDDDSSDTDVDGDFDGTGEPPSFIAPSPVNAAFPVDPENAQHVIPHYSYINWDHPDQEMDYPGLDVSGTWRPGDELYVGLRFNTKRDVQMAVSEYVMKVHQTYRTKESSNSVLSMKCPKESEGCPWRMRAIASKKTKKWTVTKWGGRHTCINAMLTQDHEKLSAEVICNIILGMVREDPSISISMIQERVSATFVYKVSYKKAWKAKQKALTKEYGDWDESYDLLPRWLERMIECTPGSIYKLDTTEYVFNNQVDLRFRKFRRVFWTFKPVIDAFNFCKPIIQIDGTFLYGKYKGTLLIATTQDGNSCVLPIAFAIVPGETLNDWSWFLAKIRRYVTQKQGICLISDRHVSIKSAVANAPAWQPPQAYHVYCVRHIASNFNHKFKNVTLKQEILGMGYTTCKNQFERRLESFREVSEPIRRWIDAISKPKWSIAYDENGRRYGHMTTNLSESVNKILKGARNLPITALVRCTHERMVEYFVKRGESARAQLATGQLYCTKLVKKMAENQEKACTFVVKRFDIQRTKFDVEEPFNAIDHTGGQTWSVVLNKYYCECGVFQAYRYPCSHVIAACAHVSINVYQYVDPAYSIQNIIQAYSAEWSPLGNQSNIPDRTGPRIVPDYSMMRTKGRPISTRLRNEMDWTESQRRQRCGHCRGEGHNRNNCPRILVEHGLIADDLDLHN